MAATGLQMDWSGVGFAPGTGSMIAINNVTDISQKDGGQPERFYGDASKYAKAMRMVNKNTTVKITSGNIAVLRSLPRDVIGSLTFTHNDFYNGSGSGALVYTLINAQVVEVDDGGGNNKTGMGSVTFEAVSSDGLTSPLSSVVTP